VVNRTSGTLALPSVSVTGMSTFRAYPDRMEALTSHHGANAQGWVQHNLPWLAILALLFSLLERTIADADAGDPTLGEDG